MSKTSQTAIILAAGKGTRMYSELPKVLHEVCGQAMLTRVLLATAALKPEKIVVVVGYGKDLVEAELGAARQRPELSGIAIETVEQKEQLGTGHAVKCAFDGSEINSDEIIILPGDVPLITAAELKQAASEKQSAEVAVTFITCDHPEPASLGRVVRDKSGAVEAIVEFKDCSEQQRKLVEINSSIYFASRKFLVSALGNLSTDNAQGEFYLTDIVSDASRSSAGVTACKISNYMSLSGSNNRYELAQLESWRRAEIVTELATLGVTFQDLDAVYIDEDVEVSADCYIGAGTRLYGKTKISSGVVLEGDTQIRDSEIGEKTLLRLGCYLDSATVGAAVAIGPFAHLRPGTEISDKAKIGNFVETKKTKLAVGAKVNHLTYLGDCEVGEGANIGAGTITCNYDGYNKFKTKIGKGAFIGSNTALVAPIEVGDGAVVGAGSTLSKNVEADSLTFTRAALRAVSGWAAKKRTKLGRSKL